MQLSAVQVSRQTRHPLPCPPLGAVFSGANTTVKFYPRPSPCLKQFSQIDVAVLNIDKCFACRSSTPPKPPFVTRNAESFFVSTTKMTFPDATSQAASLRRKSQVARQPRCSSACAKSSQRHFHQPRSMRRAIVWIAAGRQRVSGSADPDLAAPCSLLTDSTTRRQRPRENAPRRMRCRRHDE